MGHHTQVLDYFIPLKSPIEVKIRGFVQISYLNRFEQELTLRQEAGDAAGEARAHSHLGAVHMALGHYSHAARCYRVSRN